MVESEEGLHQDEAEYAGAEKGVGVVEELGCGQYIVTTTDGKKCRKVG